MIKLKKGQVKLLIIFILIITLLVVAFLIYRNNNENENLKNLEAENINELKEINQENIIKAQSYKAPSLRAVDDSDIYLGDLDADLKVVVYEDYSNTFSAKYKGSLDRLVSEYGDDIVLAFRPFSVSNNGFSSMANQALYCAQDQNKYLDYREEIFKRLNASNLYKDDLYVMAREISLDEEQFSTCLDDNKYLSKVNTISEEANNFGVFGAPTTFVANDLVIGARQWEDSVDSNGEEIEGLKTIVERHLSK
ncbi:thioredoxin domain-containing protein [Patescibacteria group bacterium]|nr:thioredoxin domain-containing protein [Patescibacteria group bacterium]